MKQLLLACAFIIGLASCSKNCDNEKAEIQKKYAEALPRSGGNPDAIAELTRQRDEQLRNLDCD